MDPLHEHGARPLKLGRVALHCGGGLLVVELILSGPLSEHWRYFSYSFAGLLVCLDLCRLLSPWLNRTLFPRLRAFTQSHESHRLTSATWFWLSMSIVAYFGDLAAFLGTLVILSVGDPAASFFGRKIKSPILIHGRSLAGTLAFVFASLNVSAIVFLRMDKNMSSPELWSIVFLASIAGALVELLTSRFDDNFTVGCSVGAIYTILGPTFIE